MKVIHFLTSIDKSSGGTAAYMHLISKELKNLVDLVLVTGNTPNPLEMNDVKIYF